MRNECNFIWGYSSAGRALEWHSRGQRFDPAYLHQESLRDSTMYLENWTLWVWCNYEKATVKEIFFSVSISKLRWVKIQFLAKKLLETWACIIQLYREPIGLSMSWLVLKSERSEHLVSVLFTNQKPSVSGFWFERRNDEARERITQGVSQAGFAEFASSISTRSSYKERKGNALASGADEGRDKLR